MADAVINYDVDKKHVDVKKMKALGYLDYVVGTGKPCYLPNTTLRKAGTTLETAF
jgi:hypothetical protein